MPEKDIAIRKKIFSEEIAKDRRSLKKVFVNKKNNQMSIQFSRKKSPAPTLKFGEELFVDLPNDLRFIKKRKNDL